MIPAKRYRSAGDEDGQQIQRRSLRGDHNSFQRSQLDPPTTSTTPSAIHMVSSAASARLTLDPPRPQPDQPSSEEDMSSASSARKHPGEGSRFGPRFYACQGYDLNENYEYFDGLSGSNDMRFAIDLDTDSMERLPDVRPYLYWMGFYQDGLQHPIHDLLGNDEDMAVEDGIVKAGRAYLRAEREAGRGYFVADRNWAEYNVGEIITMPYLGCFGENLEGDVGMTEEHTEHWQSEESKKDKTKYIVNTNIRVALPYRQIVKTQPGEKSWDIMIQMLYANHPVPKVMHVNHSVQELQNDFAIAAVPRGCLTEDALLVYADPDGVIPPMHPDEVELFKASLVKFDDGPS